ncbi:MAG: BrnT family toxin [Patescibacteria group bacterium]|nr:BrnT family toxin [Patescibacteria group bacterium]
MLSLDNYKGFEWDKGNIDKSYQKHGVTPNETEEAFLDEKAIVLKDIKHSLKERRYLLIGENASNKILLVAFTLRNKKIRIISARKANRKEKNRYAKAV